jgi:hypothetical protein
VVVLRAVVLSALIVFTLATGCGNRRLVGPIAIDPSTLAVPSTTRNLATHESAVTEVLEHLRSAVR